MSFSEEIFNSPIQTNKKAAPFVEEAAASCD